jgi:hypothetical protein
VRLKLRTQFTILIVAVTLFPIIFGLLVFTGQKNKRDPREPTRSFLNEVAVRWKQNPNLSIEYIRMAGEETCSSRPTGRSRCRRLKNCPLAPR